MTGAETIDGVDSIPSTLADRAKTRKRQAARRPISYTADVIELSDSGGDDELTLRPPIDKNHVDDDSAQSPPPAPKPKPKPKLKTKRSPIASDLDGPTATLVTVPVVSSDVPLPSSLPPSDPPPPSTMPSPSRRHTHSSSPVTPAISSRSKKHPHVTVADSDDDTQASKLSVPPVTITQPAQPLFFAGSSQPDPLSLIDEPEPELIPPTVKLKKVPKKRKGEDDDDDDDYGAKKKRKPDRKKKTDVRQEDLVASSSAPVLKGKRSKAAAKPARMVAEVEQESKSPTRQRMYVEVPSRTKPSSGVSAIASSSTLPPTDPDAESDLSPIPDSEGELQALEKVGEKKKIEEPVVPQAKGAKGRKGEKVTVAETVKKSATSRARGKKDKERTVIISDEDDDVEIRPAFDGVTVDGLVKVSAPPLILPNLSHRRFSGSIP
jgi:hypothetical protein